jgi:hypothetical protein
MRPLVLFAALSLSAQPPVPLHLPAQPVSSTFTGVGFHAEMFLDLATPEFYEQVIAKRWVEMRPAFARVFHRTGSRPALDAHLRQFLFLKQTGTEVYYTTGGPKDTQPGDEREAWVRTVVDDLQYLRENGATNLSTYCMSNELSMGKWAAMVTDLEKFKDYHRLFHAELARRRLPIALLATDASPISNWHTLDWAASHMDEITEVYGGHHYANEHAPDNLEFYSWFLEKNAAAVRLARSKGKEFILGEFGPAQYLQHRYGIRWDAGRWNDTALEPLAGLQLAEASLAAMNAGVRAMGYWTFMDYPDDRASDRINQWGLFQWMKNGAKTRAPYYAYALLTRYFRGPAEVYPLSSPDPLLRATALRHRETGAWSFAMINRAPETRRISVRGGPASGTRLRRYEYVVAHVPRTEDGDLPPATETVVIPEGEWTATLPPQSLVVFTSAFDEVTPAAVADLRAERIQYTAVPHTPTRAQRISWRASSSPDVIYYRVYHGSARVGSTIATSFVDADVRRPAGHPYRVVAVDSSGNASPASECPPGQ